MTAKDDTARAPKGKVLLRVYIGRYAQEDVTPYEDARRLAMAQTEIRETLGIGASPSFHRVIRYPNGIPQYNMGHLARIAAIEARLESHPGLFMAGAMFRGVGIPDCMASGEQVAVKVLKGFDCEPSAPLPQLQPAQQPLFRRFGRLRTGQHAGHGHGGRIG